MIAVLEGRDAGFVDEAARRGVFAYIVDGSPEELQSALDITLRRFAEYHNLQGAFGRRAQTERAKGILMERHRRRDALSRCSTARRSGRKSSPLAMGARRDGRRPAGLGRVVRRRAPRGVGRAAAAVLRGVLVLVPPEGAQLTADPRAHEHTREEQQDDDGDDHRTAPAVDALSDVARRRARLGRLTMLSCPSAATNAARTRRGGKGERRERRRPAPGRRPAVVPCARWPQRLVGDRLPNLRRRVLVVHEHVEIARWETEYRASRADRTRA